MSCWDILISISIHNRIIQIVRTLISFTSGAEQDDLCPLNFLYPLGYFYYVVVSGQWWSVCCWGYVKMPDRISFWERVVLVAVKDIYIDFY